MTEHPASPSALAPWARKGVALAGVLGLAMLAPLWAKWAFDATRAGAGGYLDPIADWRQFQRAGQAYAQGDPASLYRQDFTQDQMFWLYPPFVGTLAVPLSVLPAVVCYLLMVSLTIFSTVVAFRLTAGLAPKSSDRTLAMLALAGSAPLWATICNGQVSGLLALTLAGGLALLSAGRGLLAGLCWGLLFCKPNWAVCALGVLLVAGQGRAVVGMLITGMALGVSSLPLGVGLWADFVSSAQMADAATATRGRPTQHVTLLAFWRGVLPLAPDGLPMRALWLAGALLSGGLAALAWWRAPIDARLPRRVGVLILATLAANAYAWGYDALTLWAIAMPAWLLSANTYACHRRWTLIGGLIALLWVTQHLTMFIFQDALPASPAGPILLAWLALEVMDLRASASSGVGAAPDRDLPATCPSPAPQTATHG